MNKEKTPETDFKGPISIDAIFAATQGKNNLDIKKATAPIVDVIKDKTKIEDKDGKKEDPIIADPSPEPLIEKKKEEPIIEPPVEGVETEAYKTAKRLISLGLLEDFNIQTSEEDLEGTAISEFTGMTDDNLEEIIKIHKQEKDNEISSKYLPKGDLKEHQLKVFEILSNGGDLSQIAETPERALERPFEGLDMEDPQNQADVRYTDLVNGKGLDNESAMTIIKKEMESGKLKEKAIETFELYRSAHAKYVDDILEKQKKDKEFKDLNFKENKKALTAKLKESGLKESVYKKVATEYAKKNENGGYALVDKLVEALNNPEENHELILHLADKNLFNETFKIKASHEAQKQIVRLASSSGPKGNKQAAKSQSNDKQAPWLKIAQAHNEKIKNN